MESDSTSGKVSRLRRLVARVMVAAFAATTVAVVGVAQPAHAAWPMPIANLDSGMCLQPIATDGSIYDNGAPIWQVPCNGSPEQQWTKVFLEDGSRDCSWWRIVTFPLGFRCGFDPVFHVYYLVNSLTGSCMDVRNASGNNRAEIQQWACNGGGSEKWWLPPSSGAVGMHVPIQNVRTGKCLDVPAGTLEPSHMQQYQCTPTNGAQLFTVPTTA
jgi:hypothetical protein